MEAIFARSIDFTYVGPSPAVNAYARANGRDIRITAGAMRGGEALVVRGDTITKIEDFRDKTIATPQLGNTQDVECRAWLINNGIRVTLVGGDARVLPTGQRRHSLSLFEQGKLDAAWTVEAVSVPELLSRSWRTHLSRAGKHRDNGNGGARRLPDQESRGGSQVRGGSSGGAHPLDS